MFSQNIARPGSGDNEKEPILDSGLEPSKRKIWGMKKKTFMIMLGIFILLIIAVAVAKAKNDNNSLPPTSSSGHAPLVTITPSISSSPTPTPIRRNTPLAAVNWNTSYIQLFYKHTDGSIRFQENKGLRWGEQSPQVTKPKDDSGLAAMGWLVGDVRQVRVYTAGENNTLMESVWNSSARQWWSQDISKRLDPIAAGSHLTAYHWFEKGLEQFRVYYQGQDGYIREAAHNSTSDADWWKGEAPTIQDFPRARSGSGLAIVSFPDTDEREAKLFYQSMDGKLRSYDYKPAATWVQSWQNSTVDHGSIPDRAQVTAVSCILATGELALRIYFIRDGKLVEIWWTQKAGRNAWYMHDATAPGVSAVSSTDDVNVFFQAKTEYLSDLGINRHVIQWQFTAII